MMKKIILILSAVALLISCEDTREIIQPGELGIDAAFRNADDVAVGAFGVYTSVSLRNEILFTSFFTDEVAIGQSNGGQGLPLHEGVLNPNSGEAQAIWQGNYTAIFRANTLLTAAEDIVPEMDEQDLYDRAVGETLALRAYCFSRLLAFFGEDLQDDTALGAIVIDFPADASTQLPRGTIEETYNIIFDDLDRAEALLTSAGTTYDPFRVSLDFIRALRARVANYRGDNMLASANANAVLANFSLPANPNAADYAGLWGDVPGAAVGEIITNLDVTVNTGPTLGTIYNTNSSDVAGGPQFDMSRELFNIYEANNASNGDIRRNIFVDPSSLISPTYNTTDVAPRDSDQIVIDKYPGDPNIGGLAGAQRNDQKVIRTAEMHFILAEVAARASNFMEAARQVDLVRNARFTTPVVTSYNSQAEAFADILLERRLELAFEAHRYIDVRRLGPLANLGYDRDEIDCTLYQAPLCDRPSTDTETLYMPIPLLEFTGNPAVAGQQNPGY